MTRSRLAVRATCLGVAALVVLVMTGCGPIVTVTVSTSPPSSGADVTQLELGLTHTQYTADPSLSPTDFDTQMAVLDQFPVQNQHLMGWGALNPEPSQGQYDWTSLDERMALIQSTGAEPILTLCCAPDWMKGGASGTTNWDDIAIAPTPDHFADFASLAAAAATRYTQVHRFQVWNEMKGFYDPATNNWDSVAYTQLYNAVYDAVKAARPDAQVGGPYAPIDVWSAPNMASHPSSITGPWGVIDQRPLDLLTYWLANAHGADFVSLDGATRTRDAGFITDPFVATDVLTTMTNWVRARTDLPIWWPEFHVADPSWSQAEQDAVTTEAVARMASSGVSLAMLWQPQALGSECLSCLWSDPTLGPIQPTPLAESMAAWQRCAPPGTPRQEATSNDPAKLFVSATDRGTVMVNQTNGELSPLIGSSLSDLAGYGVAVASNNPACYR